MPFQALRFVHAASLLVDHQLQDVGRVADALRPTLIDATLTAFERLIETCVDQDVDFLLLTGDTFCESDRSLRARVTIREGFECLREAGIEVFAVPGPEDPQSAWQAFPDLPENVSLFMPQTDEPTAVMHEGHVIATIQACSPPRSDTPGSPAQATSTQTPRTSPLRISVMTPSGSSASEPDCDTIGILLQSQTADYLAVSAPYPQLTAVHGKRMAHCPGPATAISRRDTELCGCTLVTVDDAARITAEHFATSPILRLQVEIAVSEHTTWDELISMMRAEINALDALDSIHVMILEWQLTGSSELLSSLESTEAREELFELFAADTTVLSEISVSHHLQISPQAGLPEGIAREDPAAAESGDGQSAPLIAGLAARLKDTESIAHTVMEQIRNSHPDSPWVSRLEQIVSRVSQETVTAHVRRKEADWFQTGTDGQLEIRPDTWPDAARVTTDSIQTATHSAAGEDTHCASAPVESQPADQSEEATVDDSDPTGESEAA